MNDFLNKPGSVCSNASVIIANKIDPNHLSRIRSENIGIFHGISSFRLS